MTDSRAQLFANTRVRIQMNKCVLVQRTLMGQGRLSVSTNQEVAPQDILGYFTQNVGFFTVNVASKLGVSPKEGLKCLQKPLNKVIYKGELLALKKGLFGKKIVTAPTDGLIDRYDEVSGEVRLRFISKEKPMTAGVYGIVQDINFSIGQVTIKTLTTEIYGILGSGKERSGILNILSTKNSLFQPQQITKDLSQHIIVAGALIYGEALKKAVGFGVKGIICGGLNAKDYIAMVGGIDPKKKIGNDIGISTVITEGFGPIPIGDDIFDLLRQFNDRFVFVNGNENKILLPSSSPDSILTLRKISLPPSSASRPQPLPETNIGEIKMGATVRLIWPPHMGEQGKVIYIDGTKFMLKSGIATIMVTVQLRDGKKVKVPYPNLELI